MPTTESLNVYFISGMGADQRAFSYLSLPAGFEARYVRWILPHEEETLHDYALRLADQIDPSQPFILIGLSMGGMLATEIARRFPPVCTIIISSIPVAAHLPRYYKTAVKLKAASLIPTGLIKGAIKFKYWLTRKPSPASRLIHGMLQSSDEHFLKWAMTAIPEWDNEVIPHPFFHIHGANDKILPIHLTHPTHIVPGAGHILIMSHPDPINSILREILASLPTFPNPRPQSC